MTARVPENKEQMIAHVQEVLSKQRSGLQETANGLAKLRDWAENELIKYKFFPSPPSSWPGTLDLARTVLRMEMSAQEAVAALNTLVFNLVDMQSSMATLEKQLIAVNSYAYDSGHMDAFKHLVELLNASQKSKN